MESFHFFFLKSSAGHRRNSTIPRMARGRPFCRSCCTLSITHVWSGVQFKSLLSITRLSQWPRGLRRGSSPSWPPGTAGSNPARGIDVCIFSAECCQVEFSVLGLITRPGEYYRVWVCLSVILKPRQWGYPGSLGSYISRNGGCVNQNIWTYCNVLCYLEEK